MIKITGDKSRYIKPLKTGKAVWEGLCQRERLYCELLLVGEAEIKQLNKDNRNIDRVTDVLSFPSLDGIRGKLIDKKDYPLEYNKELKAIFIGSVVICEKRAREQAKEYGHSLEREYTFLTVHSLLHLMGYDHETEEDRKQMRELEKIIMDKLDLGVCV